MHKLIIAICVVFLLGGCSRHYHPLMASKKAKLVTELINDAPKCSIFKNRLASPLMEDDAIDEVYHDATQAQCVNEDI